MQEEPEPESAEGLNCATGDNTENVAEREVLVDSIAGLAEFLNNKANSALYHRSVTLALFRAPEGGLRLFSKRRAECAVTFREEANYDRHKEAEH